MHCGIRDRTFESPESVAAEFGLRSASLIYFEVDEPAALAILQRLLHEDMAYNSELMSVADAEFLANTFIELFRKQNGRYFSNGNWHLPHEEIEPNVLAHPGWTPATDATFDGGILAIGDSSSGCVWFEDED